VPVKYHEEKEIVTEAATNTKKLFLSMMLMRQALHKRGMYIHKAVHRK
jgi:hypothetical protein